MKDRSKKPKAKVIISPGEDSPLSRKLPKYRNARYRKGKKPTANSSKGKVSISKIDPSRTLSLRKGLAAELDRRFDALKKIIWDAVSVQDVLGLGDREKEQRVSNSVPVPVVEQSTDYSCGAAAFASVCRYWGVDPGTESVAARELGTSERDGTSPSQLEIVAGRAFLSCEVRRGMSLEDLRGITDSGVPVICAIQAYGTIKEKRNDEAGHWVVVTGVREGRVWIMDPSAGDSSLPRGEFIQAWHDRGKWDGEDYRRLGIIVSREPLGMVGNAHKFSSTQFNIEDCGYSRSQGSPLGKIKDMITRIPTELLAEEPQDVLPHNIHITVKYGLETQDPEEVRKIVQGFGMVTVRLGKTSLFSNEDADVIKIDVEGEDIHRLNSLLCDKLEHTDTYLDYYPHITLAYVKPGAGDSFVGWDDVEGMEIHCSRLVFSDREGNKTTIGLTPLWDGEWQDVGNIFCPTGEGGGVDPSCSPGEKGNPPKVVVDKELLDVAMRDTQSDDAIIYANQMENDAVLVIPGKPRELDRRINDGQYSMENVAKCWDRTREYLRKRYGDTVILYRADAPTVEHNPNTLTLLMADEKMAKKFEKQINLRGEEHQVRTAKPYKVKVDDIIAVPAYKRGDIRIYSEFVVKKSGLVANLSSRRDDGGVENASRYLSPKQFRDWLEKQVKRFVVNPATEKEIRKYLGAAHSKGVLRIHSEADRDLTADEGYKAGGRDQFLKGVASKSKARKLVADKAYQDLVKAAGDMTDQIDKVVQDGLKRGSTPKQMASEILKRVDGVGAYRARLIARTSIVGAHAEGQLDALEELGAPGVGVMVENSPGGNVCPDCAALAGIVYTIGEARGLLPIHVQCRCAFVFVGMAPRQRKAWRVGKRPVGNSNPDGCNQYTGPDCSPGEKRLPSPTSWSEAWQRFEDVNKNLPDAETNLTGEVRHIRLDGGRHLDISLKTLRSGEFAVRLDFGIDRKHTSFQADELQPGSKDFMTLVKKAAQMYHNAGLKLLVVPSDEKRERIYGRVLKAMGLKLGRGEGAQGQVWNFSPRRDDGHVGNAESGGNCGTGAGGFKPGNSCSTKDVIRKVAEAKARRLRSSPSPGRRESQEPQGNHVDRILAVMGNIKGSDVNLIHLGDLHQASGLGREDFVKGIHQARSEGRISLSGAEGRHGLTDRDKSSGIRETDPVTGDVRLLLYAGKVVRNALGEWEDFQP